MEFDNRLELSRLLTDFLYALANKNEINWQIIRKSLQKFPNIANFDFSQNLNAFSQLAYRSYEDSERVLCLLHIILVAENSVHIHLKHLIKILMESADVDLREGSMVLLCNLVLISLSTGNDYSLGLCSRVEILHSLRKLCDSQLKSSLWESMLNQLIERYLEQAKVEYLEMELLTDLILQSSKILRVNRSLKLLKASMLRSNFLTHQSFQKLLRSLVSVSDFKNHSDILVFLCELIETHDNLIELDEFPIATLEILTVHIVKSRPSALNSVVWKIFDSLRWRQWNDVLVLLSVFVKECENNDGYLAIAWSSKIGRICGEQYSSNLESGNEILTFISLYIKKLSSNNCDLIFDTLKRLLNDFVIDLNGSKYFQMVIWALYELNENATVSLVDGIRSLLELGFTFLQDMRLSHQQYSEIGNLLMQQTSTSLREKEFILECHLNLTIRFLIHSQKSFNSHEIISSYLEILLELAAVNRTLSQAIFNSLIILCSLSNNLSRKHQDDIITAIQLHGLKKSGGHSTEICIQGLLYMGYEWSVSTVRQLPSILSRFSQIMSSSRVGLYILQYLSHISCLPDLRVNFVDVEFKIIFGIALQYIQASTPASRDSKLSFQDTVYSQYVLIMAYHVILFWFVRTKRKNSAQFPIDKRQLLYLDFLRKALKSGIFGHRSLLCLETLDYLLFTSSLDEKKQIAEISIEEEEERYISGNLIISMRKDEHSVTSICIRSCAGKFTFKTNLNSLEFRKKLTELCGTTFHQLPINDSTISRSIFVFDKTPPVDFHKIGVLYVGPVQTKEEEILRNSSGSSSYLEMLKNLGRIHELKRIGLNKIIFTGGLDVEFGTDGKYFIAWEDECGQQVVFHVATLMNNMQSNNNEEHGNTNVLMKKRHIGNDYVSIVWDESGTNSFSLETISGQFNFVNIVIVPDTSIGQNRFRVRTLTKKSPSNDGELMAWLDNTHAVQELYFYSIAELTKYVRHEAIHANIYAQIHQQLSRRRNSGEEQGEYISNSLERLLQIDRLKKRLGVNDDRQPAEDSYALLETISSNMIMQ